jgi:FSR family fosmidomycin resistance protein-like MFS transporter
MATLLLAVRNPALLVLMMAHFTSDLFSGILPMYLPVMKDRFELSNAAIGFAILAYSGMSSLTQPVFGYFSDRQGRRWFLPATLIWSASLIAMYGFAPNYQVFLLLAALAGIGSGAFHPIGASTVAQVSEEGQRNGSMSLYTVGGTIGWGIGPLVAVALLGAFGPRGSVLLVIPGLVIGGLLYRQMAVVERVRQAQATITATMQGLERPRWGLLVRVVAVTMLRSWTFLSVLQFIPIWYDELGYGPGFYGPLVTLIIFAGAGGTLLGGVFADRIGPRRVVVGSLALAIPALLLFVGLPGPLALLTGLLFGALADASLSVTLVMAQRLVPGRIGIASGVILGLGFVTGGIGVPITGRLADAVGIQTALLSLGILCAFAALLALTLPADAPQRSPAPGAAPAPASR